MTQQDIGLLLELKIQSLGYLLSDSLEPEEVNLFLDSHTNDFIDEVLTGLRNRGSFESNVVRLGELRKLKKTSPEIVAGSITTPGQVPFTLPSDYRDYIRILPQIDADCLDSPVYNKARIIEEDVLDVLLDDTNHKSTIESPVVTIEDETVIVHLNGFTSPKLKISYIKKPENFDLVNKGNEEYPLPRSAINRIIDKTALEVIPTLKQRGGEEQGLKQSKIL